MRKLKTVPTVSPSRLTGVLSCPRQAKLDQQKGGGPPGDPALVGTLVHKVLEELHGKYAEVKHVLEVLDRVANTKTSEANRASAVEILTAYGPVDLTNEGDAELRFGFGKDPGVEIGGYKGRGIVDRVDLLEDMVVVTDYKTGVVRSREELQDAPQTVVYLAWAAETYGRSRPISMVYDYVGSGCVVRIPYDEERVRRGLKRAAEMYSEWEKTPLADCEARVQGSCSWCNHKAECPEYQRVQAGMDVPEDWRELDLAGLAKLRQQVAGDLKMLEAVKADLDARAKVLLGESDGWSDEDYGVKVTRRASSTFSVLGLEPVAKALKVPLAELAAKVCKVSVKKLEKEVGENRAAQAKLSLYRSKSKGKPFLTFTTKGGLF